MAEAEAEGEANRIGILRRAWRARWQRVRAGTPPPIVQKDANYTRKLFWSQFPESGFPPRVNHAVAAYKYVCVSEQQASASIPVPPDMI